VGASVLRQLVVAGERDSPGATRGESEGIWIDKSGRSRSRRSMSQSRMETGNAKHTIHLFDLTADHYLASDRSSWQT
jgi:hypothetical protein